MKYLISILLIYFTSIGFVNANPFVLNATTSTYEIIGDDCLMIQAIGKSAIYSKTNGMLEVAIIASLVRPAFMAQSNFRAMLPYATVMIHDIYDAKKDEVKVVASHYEKCNKTVGESISYFN